MFTALTFFSGSHLREVKPIQGDLYQSPPLIYLKPELIKIITLGHPEIYHHFIKIWLLQALMEIPEEESSPEKMMNLIRLVINHKPKLESIYMLSCFIMSKMYHSPEYCHEIVETGLSLYPKSFRLLVTQGYIYAFLLDKPLQASSYYFMASQKPDAPPHFKKLAIRLANKENISPKDIESTLSIILGRGQSSSFKQFLQDNAKIFAPKTKSQ